jgi:hypothetical protein
MRIPDNCLPGRLDGGDAYLLDIGADDLSDPLYQQSLARIHAAAHPVQLRMPVGRLRALVDAESLPGPAGLIFHTGRCGSTLLANMIGDHPRVRMLKEPEVLNQALADGHPPDTAGTVLRAFARGLDPATRVAVKCTSWNVLAIGGLLDAFPDARAVFLWRPAAEVVASNLNSPPGWVRWRDSPDLMEAWLPGCPAGAADDLSVFYGHAWRVSADAALEVAGHYAGRLRLLPYAALKADPGGTAAGVARHFGLDAGPEETARMGRRAHVYAKDPETRARFSPAGAHARGPLSRRQAEAVAAVAAGREALLERAAG